MRSSYIADLTSTAPWAQQYLSQPKFSPHGMLNIITVCKWYQYFKRIMNKNVRPVVDLSYRNGLLDTCRSIVASDTFPVMNGPRVRRPPCLPLGRERGRAVTHQPRHKPDRSLPSFRGRLGGGAVVQRTRHSRREPPPGLPLGRGRGRAVAIPIQSITCRVRR